MAGSRRNATTPRVPGSPRVSPHRRKAGGAAQLCPQQVGDMSNIAEHHGIWQHILSIPCTAVDKLRVTTRGLWR
eukprot:gene15081-biopygen4149